MSMTCRVRPWSAAPTRMHDEHMTDAVVESLLRDLLEWLAAGERDYIEVMDAWRTSCPKLPVWEEANDRGLVEVQWTEGRSIVHLTPKGRQLLAI